MGSADSALLPEHEQAPLLKVNCARTVKIDSGDHVQHLLLCRLLAQRSEHRAKFFEVNIAAAVLSIG